MDLTGPTARRFPLVARVRPVCLPLPARIATLAELAGAADRDADHGAASSVFNQAALLASDLGLPDLARRWCHRHALTYLRACPLGGMDAIRGLEPLVNLARLHIRASRGDQARHLLLALYEAATTGTPVTLDGIIVPAELTTTDADRQEVRQWLWRVIIADGTRALTATGRWQEALTHLRQHHGVGQRMLDGRQVAVLACATTDDDAGAQRLLADTAPGEPWENAVTACLTALCHPPHRRPTGRHINALVDRCCQLDVQPNFIVFCTRLMLTAVDLAGPGSQPALTKHARALAGRIVEIGDGYAARDVLAHNGSVSLLTANNLRGLAQATEACALGHRAVPEELRAELFRSLDISEAVITRTMTDAKC